MATYREDMRRAWDRINSFPTQRLQTRFGTIEYADQGEGTPLLVSHGVLGCHVDTVDSWWAELPGRRLGRREAVQVAVQPSPGSPRCSSAGRRNPRRSSGQGGLGLGRAARSSGAVPAWPCAGSGEGPPRQYQPTSPAPWIKTKVAITRPPFLDQVQSRSDGGRAPSERRCRVQKPPIGSVSWSFFEFAPLPRLGGQDGGSNWSTGRDTCFVNIVGPYRAAWRIPGWCSTSSDS
jgi:hypothetical protein